MTPPLDVPAFSDSLGRREQILVDWKLFFQSYPLIVMPPCWSRPFAQDFDQQGLPEFTTMVNALSPTFCASLLGLPSLVVPTGVVDGLPTGVEIVGDQFREDTCFDAGEVVEAAVRMPTPIDPRS
jgi:amidase